MTKILAFAGSARRGSFNVKLAILAAEMARKHGASVTLLDMRDYPLPFYDGDLEAEEGLPENADRLYELMKGHDGFLIACPEYNSSITPLLKNTIDWVSRPRPGDPSLAAFTGKVAALVSASPGQLGGLRGLVHVRSILGNLGMHVIPAQAAVSAANEAFTESGELKDERVAKRVDDVARQLVETTRRLHSS